MGVRYALLYTCFLTMLLCSGCYRLEEKITATEIRLGFVGDIMLGRGVYEAVAAYGYRYPWGDMLPYLHKVDFLLGNLEMVFTDATTQAAKVFTFKAPPSAVQTLAEAGIDLVTLANNHSLDFGVSGLMESLTVLERAQIQTVGAGATYAMAQRPAIMSVNELRIGVLGMTDNEPGWAAGRDTPGTWYLPVERLDEAKDAVALLRPQVDILIVTMHWGPNNRVQPSDAFVDFAHALIDAGVDIFHGHSAHVMQGIEWYNDKLIMYDTGDFVDDYVVDPLLRNDLSALFVVLVQEGRVIQLALVPAVIKNHRVEHAKGVDARTVFDIMQQRSSVFGTQFYQEQGMLVTQP